MVKQSQEYNDMFCDILAHIDTIMDTYLHDLTNILGFQKDKIQLSKLNRI